MAQKKTKKTSAPVTAKNRFLRSFIESQTFNISESCKAAVIGRRTFYNWLESDSDFSSKFEELKESRDDAIEAALFSKAVTDKDTTALIFLCKTLLKNKGYVEGGRVLVTDTGPALAKIIDALLEGKTTLDQAALELTKAGIPLPESIKIMLGRYTVPEAEPCYDAPSVEELEQRAQERFAAIEEQRRCFLPERRKEIQQLKEELKQHDSFGS